jgi:hypothetical protein
MSDVVAVALITASSTLVAGVGGAAIREWWAWKAKVAEVEARRSEAALSLLMAVERWRRRRFGFDRSIRRKVEEALDVSLAGLAAAGGNGVGFVDRFVLMCIAESEAYDDAGIHEEIGSYCAFQLRRWLQGEVRAKDLPGADGSTLPARFWSPPQGEATTS